MKPNPFISRLLPFLMILYISLQLYVAQNPNYTTSNLPVLLSIGFIFMIILFEIIFPYRNDWHFWNDRQSFNDIILYLVNTIVILKCAPNLTILKNKLHLTNITIWPEELPLLLQLLLAFIIFDFFYYWFHRLSHTIRYLWIFHAVHHSAEKIHFLKGNRSNLFFDALPYFVLTVFPLAFLNPPNQIFIMMAIILRDFSFMIHSNISLQFPSWWEKLFVSPKLHQMHHDKFIDNGMGYNFSTLTLIWDKIFGTFKPFDNLKTISTGIENDPVSKNVFWQIFFPFKK